MITSVDTCSSSKAHLVTVHVKPYYGNSGAALEPTTFTRLTNNSTPVSIPHQPTWQDVIDRIELTVDGLVDQLVKASDAERAVLRKADCLCLAKPRTSTHRIILGGACIDAAVVTVDWHMSTITSPQRLVGRKLFFESRETITFDPDLPDLAIFIQGS